MLGKESTEKSGKEKCRMLFLILKTMVKAYSQKTCLSLAKEPDETTCVPDMSRCVSTINGGK